MHGYKEWLVRAHTCMHMHTCTLLCMHVHTHMGTAAAAAAAPIALTCTLSALLHIHRFCTACRVAALAQVFSGGAVGTAARGMETLYLNLHDYAPTLHAGTQQDAHEFLVALLNSMAPQAVSEIETWYEWLCISHHVTPGGAVVWLGLAAILQRCVSPMCHLLSVQCAGSKRGGKPRAVIGYS
jgi:hypothetical protein